MARVCAKPSAPRSETWCGEQCHVVCPSARAPRKNAKLVSLSGAMVSAGSITNNNRIPAS
jgi:hypothetical protein